MTIIGFRTAFALLIVMIASLAVASCQTGAPPYSPPPTSSPVINEKVITPADSPKLPPRGFYMGLLPTPAEEQDFAEAYQEASKFSEFIPVWGRPTPFYKMSEELSGNWGQIFLKQYIRGNNMFPIIHMSFIGTGMTLETPLNTTRATLDNLEWRNSYKQAALDIAEAVKPLYLSLGNEVNRWYEQYGAKTGDPNGFQHYISLYDEIYKEVKYISPQTKVFCTFAREIVAQNREADLAVIEKFDDKKMDLLVFTSYPYSVRGINHPADIPNDYYARALSYMPGKPFGFSELGWAALEAFGSEEGQADFITQAANRLTLEQGIKLQLFGWAWLSALDNNDAVALINRDGSHRLAYEAWQKLSVSGK